MALFGQGLGQLSGDEAADLEQIASFLAYMQEQLEYNDSNIKKRLAALEEG